MGVKRRLKKNPAVKPVSILQSLHVKQHKILKHDRSDLIDDAFLFTEKTTWEGYGCVLGTAAGRNECKGFWR